MTQTFEDFDGVFVEALFLLLDSVMERSTGIYLCGPISSGREFLEVSVSRREEVERMHRSRMRMHAASLRGRVTIPVIDPSVLQVDTWGGKEIGEFFLAVIRNWCCEIRCLDGWEYSRGATKEVVSAIEWAIPVKTLSGRSLSQDEVCAKIFNAIDWYRSQRRVDLAEVLASRLEWLNVGSQAGWSPSS